MTNNFDSIRSKPEKTIADLRRTVDHYMRNGVDGDAFSNELEFENAVRRMLKESGFEVLDKHNVANTNAMVEERHFTDVDAQIPDLAVLCAEGLVLIEVKLRREESAYKSDIDKTSIYVRKHKCVAAGSLFLDNEYHTGWVRCLANDKYYYYWKV